MKNKCSAEVNFDTNGTPYTNFSVAICYYVSGVPYSEVRYFLCCYLRDALIVRLAMRCFFEGIFGGGGWGYSDAHAHALIVRLAMLSAIAFSECTTLTDYLWSGGVGLFC